MLGGLIFQFFDMRHEFVRIGQASEAKADHLVSPKCWLLSRLQRKLTCEQ